MNYSEFWSLPNTAQKLEFYFIVRKIQKSLIYNEDPNAVVIHHLRDTEEQRKHNDEHYELWGHNLDGSFEYGKYVIFVTKEEHNEIHRCSNESKKYLSDKMKDIWKDSRYRDHLMSIRRSESYRKKLSESMKNKWKDEEFRSNIIAYYGDDRRARLSAKLSGENNPFYGKHHSKEARQKISESHVGMCSGENHWNYGKHWSDEIRAKMSESAKNRPAITDETKEKIRSSLNVIRDAYYKHKNDGGTMTWNEFQKYYRSVYRE